MADISAEIAAFQNAVYGEEVRSSMVSAIEKINDVCEDAESTVDSFESSITTAISNANTAASAANTAASNANTKASAANTAATNANTARTAANNAATAANNAASAATTTNTNITNAESARVTAEQARATAESARQANEQSRQTAETARANAESARTSAESSRASAESQRQSNESTRQGNETVRQTQEGLRVSAESSRVNEFEDMQAAFADMQRQIVPQATTSTMGGVIVGDGLNVDNALLSLATTKSGSGTAVASNGAVLESVVVYGQSVQDGTPTPSEPVDIQVVEGRNLVDFANPASVNTDGGVTFTINADGSYDVHGTATKNTYIYVTNNSSGFQLPAGSYTFSARNQDGSYPSVLRVGASRWLNGTNTSLGSASDHALTFNHDGQGNLQFIVYVNNGGTVNATVYPQLEAGSTATPYAPYGAISIAMGNTVTPIDLQGNVLASLPDGTRDTVTVDSAGHCVLEKNVGAITFNGSETWTAWGNGKSYYTAVSTGGGYNVHSALCDYFQYSDGNASPAQNHFTFNRYSGSDLRWNKNISFNYDNAGNDVASWKTWLSSNPVTVYYPLNTPTTIDLGYIDMPTIPEDATISVSASITPVIDAAWWERGAEALANIVKAFSERIKALEEAVAELATA